MAARSTRLAGVNTVTGSTWTLLYTVPAGKRAVIKDWSVYHSQGNVSYFQLTTSAYSFADTLDQINPPAYGLARRGQCFFVLHEGDELWGYYGEPNTVECYVAVHGMLLEE